jgi:transposase
VVGISSGRGLCSFLIRDHSIRKEDFLKFVSLMDKRIKERDVTVFLDNLRMHKSLEVQDAWKKLGWDCIFNGPYSPQYNCIEEYFSIVKRKYKKLCLSADFKMTGEEHLNLVEKCIKGVKRQAIDNIVMRGFELGKQYIRVQSNLQEV